MKPSSLRLFAAFLLCVLVASGCERGSAAAKPGGGAVPPPPGVTVAKPIQRMVMEWDVYSGRLAAVDMVEVRARVSGFLDAADFEEGELVHKGKVLYKIDPKPFKNALDAAEAEVQRTTAQFIFDEAEEIRIEGLAKEGAASPKELRDVRLMRLRSEAAKHGAEAMRKTAKLNLDYTDVVAPIAGRIGRKLVDPGNLITGGAGNSTQSTLLTTIVSVDRIHCYVDADERSVLKYQQMARDLLKTSPRNAIVPCWVGLLNETGFPHKGSVDFVENSINPETGTMTVRAEILDPNGSLTPGLFARLRVAGTARYEALIVPDPSVMTDQNLKFVFVVDAQGKALKKHVEVGPLYRGMRVILSGLTQDDQVVINGQARIRENMPVTAKLVEMPLPKDFMAEDKDEAESAMTVRPPKPKAPEKAPTPPAPNTKSETPVDPAPPAPSKQEGVK